MPTEYMPSVFVVDKNGQEIEAELRLMTGSAIDVDTSVETDKPVVAQLGLFDFNDGEMLFTADLTEEAHRALRIALA